jgi:hypothetical protein
MAPSSDDPALADTVTACRITIDTLSGDFSYDFPELTERIIQSFASLASEGFMRERQAVRLLTEDQRRQYDADRTAWPDDGLRAEARAEVEVIMANAMLRQLGDES